MGFSSWWKSLTRTQLPINHNFLLDLGTKVSTSKINDRQAIELGYLTSSAWYTISNVAAKGISSLPICIGVKDSQGNIEKIESGEVYDWFMYPNKETSLQEFWYQTLIYYFVNGELFEHFDADSVGFMGGQRRTLPPELMTVICDEQDRILSNVIGYEFDDNGKTTTYLPEEILHLRMFNPSIEGLQNKNGLSPLNAGLNFLNSGNNIETAMSWYFENRGASNLIYGQANEYGISISEKDKKMLDAALADRLGGAHKMNRTIVTGAAIGGVQNLAASATDMQMLENYNLVLRRLCSMINLPSILVNDNEQSTYNNKLEAKKEAYTELFIPTAEAIINGYDRTWLKMWRDRTGQDLVMYVDREKIVALQPDPFEYRRELREDVRAGIISRDEARMKQGLEEYGTPEMQTPTVQNNLVPIDTIDNEQQV